MIISVAIVISGIFFLTSLTTSEIPVQWPSSFFAIFSHFHLHSIEKLEDSVVIAVGKVKLTCQKPWDIHGFIIPNTNLIVSLNIGTIFQEIN